MPLAGPFALITHGLNRPLTYKERTYGEACPATAYESANDHFVMKT
jgi:hypothetical protein